MNMHSFHVAHHAKLDSRIYTCTSTFQLVLKSNCTFFTITIIFLSFQASEFLSSSNEIILLNLGEQ